MFKSVHTKDGLGFMVLCKLIPRGRNDSSIKNSPLKIEGRFVPISLHQTKSRSTTLFP